MKCWIANTDCCEDRASVLCTSLAFLDHFGTNAKESLCNQIVCHVFGHRFDCRTVVFANVPLVSGHKILGPHDL